jgi:CubicO group peptidase (beta-lactamase class C family)
MSSYRQLAELCESARKAKLFPSYSCAIISPKGVEIFCGGNLTYEENALAVTEDTLYDVASLTKVIGPMAVLMRLIDRGIVKMEDKVGTYLPDFMNDPTKDDVTILHLLTYTIDYELPKWAKSYMQSLLPSVLAQRTLQLPLKAPPGTSYLYTNITAFIAAQLIEKITGKDFYQVVEDEVFVPLSMRTATFTPPKELWSHIPPTEITVDRGVVQGFVHDESTYHLNSGGIQSGAAGLFASAKDVAHFLRMAVTGGESEGEKNGVPYFSESMRENWTVNHFPQLLPVLTPMGWGDVNNDMIKKYPGRFILKAGFTGCFMIGDMKNKTGVLLLSNLTYPTRPLERPLFTQLKNTMLEMLLNGDV